MAAVGAGSAATADFAGATDGEADAEGDAVAAAFFMDGVVLPAVILAAISSPRLLPRVLISDRAATARLCPSSLG